MEIDTSPSIGMEKILLGSSISTTLSTLSLISLSFTHRQTEGFRRALKGNMNLETLIMSNCLIQSKMQLRGVLLEGMNVHNLNFSRQPLLFEEVFCLERSFLGTQNRFPKLFCLKVKLFEYDIRASLLQLLRNYTGNHSIPQPEFLESSFESLNARETFYLKNLRLKK